MNKKQIVALATCVATVALSVAGATLAYFTDTDAQKNTFTTGNVSIDLWEDFGNNSGVEKLIPATGSAQAGTLQNGIKKEVYVGNTGSEDAYVRVHIAIPQVLDNGADSFDAGKNVLHFNYAPESVEEGMWDWSKAIDDGVTTNNWNYYETEIDNVKYNVYVVTYTTALESNEVTCEAISQVYLDSKVTNEDITKIKTTLGDNWYIYVVAEGCQTDGFANAYEALNASFGTPGSYTVDFKAASKGMTFADKVSAD